MKNQKVWIEVIYTYPVRLSIQWWPPWPPQSSARHRRRASASAPLPPSPEPPHRRWTPSRPTPPAPASESAPPRHRTRTSPTRSRKQGARRCAQTAPMAARTACRGGRGWRLRLRLRRPWPPLSRLLLLPLIWKP